MIIRCTMISAALLLHIISSQTEHVRIRSNDARAGRTSFLVLAKEENDSNIRVRRRLSEGSQNRDDTGWGIENVFGERRNFFFNGRRNYRTSSGGKLMTTGGRKEGRALDSKSAKSSKNTKTSKSSKSSKTSKASKSDFSFTYSPSMAPTFSMTTSPSSKSSKGSKGSKSSKSAKSDKSGKSGKGEGGDSKSGKGSAPSPGGDSKSGKGEGGGGTSPPAPSPGGGEPAGKAGKATNKDYDYSMRKNDYSDGPV